MSGRDQVAGIDHEVRRQRRHLTEHIGNVGIGHVRAHVDVRQLHEARAAEARRQPAHGQIQAHARLQHWHGGHCYATSTVCVPMN